MLPDVLDKTDLLPIGVTDCDSPIEALLATVLETEQFVLLLLDGLLPVCLTDSLLEFSREDEASFEPLLLL